jgi:type II secretory pathway pseudopilin PulG
MPPQMQEQLGTAMVQAAQQQMQQIQMQQQMMKQGGLPNVPVV